jgi:hypothetical protein
MTQLSVGLGCLVSLRKAPLAALDSVGWLKGERSHKANGIYFSRLGMSPAVANASPDELSKLARSAVNILKKNVSPDIFCDHETMSVLPSLFDGWRCRKALRDEAQKRSELFTALRDCGSRTKQDPQR